MKVEIAGKNVGDKISLRAVKKTVQRILGILNRRKAELSLALVGNREMEELNASYRHKDEPTDVLSFPAGEDSPAGRDFLGDVVISVEQAGIQARRSGKRLEQEIEGLLIHGILHLLGYDHERSRRDAKIMRGMEKKISRALCGTRALRV